MAKTFKADSLQGGETMTTEGDQLDIDQGLRALVGDVRDVADMAITGHSSGSKKVSLGTLPIKADHNMAEIFRDRNPYDRSRPVIVVCAASGQVVLGAKTPKKLGLQNVSLIEGGTKGWEAIDLRPEQPGVGS